MQWVWNLNPVYRDPHLNFLWPSHTRCDCDWPLGGARLHLLLPSQAHNFFPGWKVSVSHCYLCLSVCNLTFDSDFCVWRLQVFLCCVWVLGVRSGLLAPVTTLSSWPQSCPTPSASCCSHGYLSQSPFQHLNLAYTYSNSPVKYHSNIWNKRQYFLIQFQSAVTHRDYF